MPRLLTPRSAALPSAAISIMALEPSTKLASILGFIRLRVAGGPLHVDVGDGDDLHAGDPADLRDETSAHLPRTDEADPDRLPGRRLPVEEAFAVCHLGSPSQCWTVRERGQEDVDRNSMTSSGWTSGIPPVACTAPGSRFWLGWST